MDTATNARRVVHVVADSDSRWKWGTSLARRIAPGARMRGTLLVGPATPTDRQLHDVGALEPESIQRADVPQTLDDLAASGTDIVVLACVGGAVQALLHGMAHRWAGRSPRPVVVTGYVGLVYERVADGLALRAGADVVLANSTADAERFRALFSGLGVDPAAVLDAALPFLADRRYDASTAPRQRPFTVTFVAQPGVPGTRDERRYALDQLIEHARIHPRRRVVVKLRGRVGERTTHVEPYHYTALRPAAGLPTNLEFAYGAMSPVLDRTDLCVSVSSTAALEAMHRGIPTAVLTDFGVREELGNHAFVGSGALTSWRRLHDGALPTADATWLSTHGAPPDDPWPAVIARIDELVARRRQLPALRSWLASAGADAYLPSLLARYGLDVSGRPLDADATPALHRRALRASARRAYRLGVRTLEPRIRRMAQL